jgi:hypothetical protein
MDDQLKNSIRLPNSSRMVQQVLAGEKLKVVVLKMMQRFVNCMQIFGTSTFERINT